MVWRPRSLNRTVPATRTITAPGGYSWLVSVGASGTVAKVRFGWVILLVVGVVVGTFAALIAFLVDSRIGINANYPLNEFGLIVSVELGFGISVVAAAFGIVARLVAVRAWPHRRWTEAVAVAIGCLLGGLFGSLLMRNGLDSWAEAIFESEIVGVPVAIALALSVGIKHAIDRRKAIQLR
jgi:hypothetical protein